MTQPPFVPAEFLNRSLDFIATHPLVSILVVCALYTAGMVALVRIGSWLWRTDVRITPAQHDLSRFAADASGYVQRGRPVWTDDNEAA